MQFTSLLMVFRLYVKFKMIYISPVFLFSNKDKLACMQMTKKEMQDS